MNLCIFSAHQPDACAEMDLSIVEAGHQSNILLGPKWPLLVAPPTTQTNMNSPHYYSCCLSLAKHTDIREESPYNGALDIC